MPFPLLVCREMVAYANGNRYDVERILRNNLKHIGKKHAQGKGGVLGVTTRKIEEDWGWIKDGCATRFLPVSDECARKVRCKPPYWNIVDAVSCCEIGENYQR